MVFSTDALKNFNTFALRDRNGKLASFSSFVPQTCNLLALRLCFSSFLDNKFSLAVPLHFWLPCRCPIVRDGVDLTVVSLRFLSVLLSLNFTTLLEIPRINILVLKLCCA
jgi:hypothetical protein